MGKPDFFYFLLTVCTGQTIELCALKIKRGVLSDYCLDCPMEPENIRKYNQFLPDLFRDLSNVAKIVKIEAITDIIIVESEVEE